MRFGSVCSGIEAASVAWHPLGWQAAWLAEIEPFPSAVLAHHYPEVPNLGDMTKIAARILAGEIEAPDVLVGGTPCQAFSVAGLRKSLDDERGQLSLAFIHLADAIDAFRSVSGRSPATIVWENVPGVLSTSDNAFGCFLAGLVGEECELQPAGKKWANAGCVYGPKRAAAWRILDAQYFGVAQRRRRVFVVASSRDWLDPAEVLFERSSLRRDSPPSREAGEEVTPTIRAGASNGGAGHGARSGDSRDELIVPVASTGDISHFLNAGGMGRIDYETETMVVQCVTGDVAHTLKAEGFDASEDGTGRGNPIVAFPANLSGTQAAATEDLNASDCLERHRDFDIAHGFHWQNGFGVSVDNGISGTLIKNQTPAMFFEMQVRRMTPVECERLQGFPEMVKTCTITVFQHSNSNVCLSDQQSTNVLAALQSHKSPNNASPAEENVFPSNANAAEPNLNVGQASSSAPVLVNAQIDLERQHLQLHSQGKLLLSVSIADASEWCRLPIQAADFVQLSAALLTWLERKAPHGRAESRLNTSGSFPLLIGNLFASLSGQEIEELASDAGKFTSAVKDCMKSITSEAGRNSKSCDSILQTLLCCVSTAISSFIPEETRAASSYALSVEVSHGYTLIPWRNKPASECPDGPRYKALGNSMAVPVMRWIGRRIDQAKKGGE